MAEHVVWNPSLGGLAEILKQKEPLALHSVVQVTPYDIVLVFEPIQPPMMSVSSLPVYTVTMPPYVPTTWGWSAGS